MPRYNQAGSGAFSARRLGIYAKVARDAAQYIGQQAARNFRSRIAPYLQYPSDLVDLDTGLSPFYGPAGRVLGGAAGAASVYGGLKRAYDYMTSPTNSTQLNKKTPIGTQWVVKPGLPSIPVPKYGYSQVAGRVYDDRPWAKQFYKLQPHQRITDKNKFLFNTLLNGFAY